MTGAEHYREAERLLAMAALQFDTEVREAAQFNLAEAQVHATLALAAAAAMNDGQAGMNRADSSAWYDVAGVKRDGAS